MTVYRCRAWSARYYPNNIISLNAGPDRLEITLVLYVENPCYPRHLNLTLNIGRAGLANLPRDNSKP